MDQEEFSMRMNKSRLYDQTIPANIKIPDEGPKTTSGLLLLIFFSMLSRLSCLIWFIVSNLVYKLPLASMGKAVPIPVFSRSFGKKGMCIICISLQEEIRAKRIRATARWTLLHN